MLVVWLQQFQIFVVMSPVDLVVSDCPNSFFFSLSCIFMGASMQYFKYSLLLCWKLSKVTDFLAHDYGYFVQCPSCLSKKKNIETVDLYCIRKPYWNPSNHFSYCFLPQTTSNSICNDHSEFYVVVIDMWKDISVLFIASYCVYINCHS